VRYSSTLSLTSTLNMVGCHRHAPAALSPGMSPGTYCMAGFVSPRSGMDECGKISSPPGFDPRAAQPVASRYTDRAIPAHVYCLIMPQSGVSAFASIFWLLRRGRTLLDFCKSSTELGIDRRNVWRTWFVLNCLGEIMWHNIQRRSS